MLPTHVFADVDVCLNLYDLDALLLTDARCSDVAHLAASEIRVFDFSEFKFDVYKKEVFVFKMTDGKDLAEVTTLNFLHDAHLADFIPAALRNCILGNLGLIHNGCFDAMSKVAQTVVVKDTLVLFASMFVSVHALVELVARFSSVKNVRVFPTDIWNESMAAELVNLLDCHGFAQSETCSLFFRNRSA